MDEVKLYCWNDCEATLKLYHETKEKISLRKQLSKVYNLDLMNLSDSSIGEQIFIKYILEAKKIDFKELKALVRKPETFNFNLGDLIPSYVKFKSDEFNSVVDFFKQSNVDNGILKNVFNYTVNYKGLDYDYGAGGLHGTKKGIWEEDEEYCLVDIDASAYYPKLAIGNKLYPEHIGKIFCDIYEEMYDTRTKAKKQCKIDPNDEFAKAMNAGIKLASNSCYGKGNSIYSVLYSPTYVASTTVLGQLCLSMLAEQLSSFSEVFYVNTDGLTVKIKKSLLEHMYDVCSKWETVTKHELEYVKFKKMIIRDVNNFIALDEYGNTKYKGAYEIDKRVGKELAIWKNNSYRILPIATSEYLLNNIPIEQTIKNHNDIYDFCAMGKAKRGWSIYQGDIKHPNINRYYITTNETKDTLIKVNNEDGRIISLEAHPKNKKEGKVYHCEVINKFVDRKEYYIDYDYYIENTQKLIDAIYEIS